MLFLYELDYNMRYFIIILILVFGLNESFGQRKRTPLQTKSSLAIKYYSAKDYEKAIPLLKEVYQLSRNGTYFRYYIICLVETRKYDAAESEIETEIKKQKTPRPDFYIHWQCLFNLG